MRPERYFLFMVVTSLLIVSSTSCSSDSPTDPVLSDDEPGDCMVSKAKLDFGNVRLGAGKTMSFWITNEGIDTLNGVISQTSVVYRITSGVGFFSLAPGERQSVFVSFSPTSKGTRVSTVETGLACSNVVCTGSGI